MSVYDYLLFENAHHRAEELRRQYGEGALAQAKKELEEASARGESIYRLAVCETTIGALEGRF